MIRLAATNAVGTATPIVLRADRREKAAAHSPLVFTLSIEITSH
jgi:hypothetical protein